MREVHACAARRRLQRLKCRVAAQARHRELNGVQGTTVLQQVTTANHAIRVAFKSAWCQ
mgnify:CR=1 FL=1